MKKALFIIIALVMVASIVSTGFAQEGNTPELSGAEYVICVAFHKEKTTDAREFYFHRNSDDGYMINSEEFANVEEGSDITCVVRFEPNVKHVLVDGEIYKLFYPTTTQFSYKYQSNQIIFVQLVTPEYINKLLNQYNMINLSESTPAARYLAARNLCITDPQGQEWACKMLENWE